MTYLNVGVLRNELYEPLEAIKKVRGQAEQGFDDFVVFVGFLHLTPVVPEYDSDKLDESKQEGAHGDGPKMEPEAPVETSRDRSFSVRVRGATKVPYSARS
jgi:hypothetical protein